MSTAPAVVVLTPEQLRELVAEAAREVVAALPAVKAEESAPAGYMKVSKAAAYADLDESTIRGFIREGKLRRYKGGTRHHLVKIAELDALLEQLGAAGGDDVDVGEAARAIFARGGKR